VQGGTEKGYTAGVQATKTKWVGKNTQLRKTAKKEKYTTQKKKVLDGGTRKKTQKRG